VLSGDFDLSRATVRDPPRSATAIVLPSACHPRGAVEAIEAVAARAATGVVLEKVDVDRGGDGDGAVSESA